MDKKNNYKWCFVPLCKNNSNKTPDKKFFTVPKDDKRWKAWFKAVRREMPQSASSFLCCEDHFNLQEDVENYLYYSMMGGPIKFKPSVVPHIFDCQPDRKRAASTEARPLAEKRRRLREINYMLMENQCVKMQNETQVPLNNPLSITNNDNQLDDSTRNRIQTKIADNEKFSRTIEIIEENKENVTFEDKGVQVIPVVKHEGVQVQCSTQNLLTFKSQKIQVDIKPSLRHVKCSTSDFDEQFIALGQENRKIKVVGTVVNSDGASQGGTSCTTTSQSATTSSSGGNLSEYVPSEEKNSSDSNDMTNERDMRALNVINYFISTNPKSYVGIPEEWDCLIEYLQKKTSIRADYVKLTLMKIKTDDTFQRLSDQFSMSSSHAVKIFNRTIPILAHILKPLIFFPDQRIIKKNLPIPFRANYHDVCAVIDAFEIQIEHLSNPSHQALTWSEYKKCNTLKYLISSTPDGFINHVSKGYGGRISDELLFEVSGIMVEVPEKCAVMADRGFKRIQQILDKKKCTLIKPPSVTQSQQPSKAEVLEAKKIASLRIHIERVIRRLREFKYLRPHAVIHHNMTATTDDIVTIACALINLQSVIIKSQI